ncbi:MAG: pyridoxamine kinase [Bacteroidales bacterium]
MRNPLQRVAAIHDISGFSRVSLTAIIPILSFMGMQVCPLPTAVLSAHGQYDGFKKVDLTDYLESFIDHWKKLGLSFDAIYSGYLGSHEQINIVIDFIKHFQQPGQMVVIDPVLGDNGKIYSAFNTEMVKGMQSLIAHADVITPNLTELALLLDIGYSELLNINDLKSCILGLADMGPDIVIVTSVPEENVKNKTSVVAYNKKNKLFWKVSCNYLPASYPGTGDSFTSVILGSLLQGDSLPIALDRAVNFISYGVRATFGYDYDQKEGILLEKVLKSLDTPAQISSYELLD